MAAARSFVLTAAVTVLSVTGVVSAAPSPTDAEQTRSGQFGSSLVDHDGVRIEVLTNGSGPPIILLPAMGRGADDFSAVASLVGRDGFRVLRPQPRLAGRSSGPIEGASLEKFAHDLATVIDQEHCGPVILVGHGFGAFVARRYAIDHPAMVRGLVVIGAGSVTYPRKLLDQSLKLSDPNLPAAQRAQILRDQMFAPGKSIAPWMTGWHRATHLGQFATTTSPGHVGAVSVGYPETIPILDLQGEDDVYRPAATRNELRDKLGDRVTVNVVNGSGHVLIQEDPAAVARDIEQWAQGLPKSPKQQN